VSNLVLSCHACNTAKGDQTAAEFGHPHVEGQAKLPLRDAAAVNATRFAIVEALRVLGMPIRTLSRTATAGTASGLASRRRTVWMPCAWETWLVCRCPSRARSASARRDAGATSARMWMRLASHVGT
jgi:hypothetical protein